MAAGVLATLSAAGILASVACLRMNQPPGYGHARVDALVMVGILAGGGLGFAVSATWAVGAIAIAAVGIATVPLNGLIPHAAADAMPEGRHAEGFAILGSVYAGGYALGSLSLALLPLR